MWRTSTTLALLLLGACQQDDAKAKSSPAPVTVCAMVANPRAFQNKLVSLDADVSSDGMHFTLLMDAPSPCDRGLVLNWDDAAAPQGAERILEAIWHSWPGTSNKTIRGRFTGRLRYQERLDGLFPWCLVVSRIENLEIAIGERPW